MQTPTNAAAVADMESELRQLRQQNKELRSRLEVLTNNSKHEQAAGGRKSRRSTTPPNNVTLAASADDNYQLYRTPNQTPEQNKDVAKNITDDDNKSRGVKMNSRLLHEVEMGTLESHKSRQQQHLKMKKNRDGGGNYERAPSHGAGDEEEPALIINDNGDDSDAFIDDDSHNKHQSRRNKNQGISSSSSGIAATSHNFPPFTEQIRERAGWLIGLLFFQSCSSFIIAYNEQFLQTHMVIVQFLTMLVGAGGNAGNQSAVGVIRGLAVGIINGHTWKAYLKQEAKMALGLSFLIGLTGFIRAAMFRTPWGETIAITTSVSIIVVTSVAIGSTLPLAMKKVGIDPAHSSTTIQVVMDILGVLITVCVSSFVMSFQVFQSETDQGTDDAYKIDTADVGG
ncbi:hypothetical protein ACHAWC_011472 [Mediolabrus comicus]